MQYFTYKDYITCIHTFRLNAVLRLAEKSTEYTINKTNKQYSHDKFIKTVFSQKEEVVVFLNTYLNMRHIIKKEDIEKCKNSFITKKYKAKEADIVYRLKNKDVFFLIEHQSTIDMDMPYRMLNYCVDIIQEWKKDKNMFQIKQYPLIVPIVIYTGEKKWKVWHNFKRTQVNEEELEKFRIDLKYNLIDIHKLSEHELLKQKTMFSYAMLIEKANNELTLFKKLEKIIANEKDKKKLLNFIDMIIYLFKDILDEKTKDYLLEEIRKKVGDRNMSGLYERLRKEREELKTQGREEGWQEGRREGIIQGMSKLKYEIIESMLNKNVKEEFIIETIKATKEEIEDVKNKMQQKIAK